MLHIPSLQLIGKFTKTHGYTGALILVSEDIPMDALAELRELFVVIDGLYVPFPIEELTLRTDTSALVKLEFVDDLTTASDLVACEVYADIIYNEQKEAGWEQWLGYTVHDAKYGNIGIIRNIEDYNGNMVLQMMDGNREILISLFPGLISNVNQKTKTLYMTAPEGYFES